MHRPDAEVGGPPPFLKKTALGFNSTIARVNEASAINIVLATHKGPLQLCQYTTQYVCDGAKTGHRYN